MSVPKMADMLLILGYAVAVSWSIHAYRNTYGIFGGFEGDRNLRIADLAVFGIALIGIARRMRGSRRKHKNDAPPQERQDE